MPVVRMLPLYALLLAACSDPSNPNTPKVSPGVNCQDACAAGFHWAIDREMSDPVKCRGESEYSRGCREAVAYVRSSKHL